ncbi:MAG: methyltransferase [Pseudomonadota bacterium]
MRVGLKGESVAEKLFIASGMLPEKALLPFFTTVVSNAVLTAQRLDLFTLLADKSLSTDEIVEKLDSDHHATKVLLEALTAFGYLDREKDLFKLNGEFQKSLNGRMSEAAKSIMQFAPDIARNFEKLDEAVKTGAVDNMHFNPSTPTCWPNYLSFLKNVSEDGTKSLVKTTRFSNPPLKMLDVAGGPAQYSIAFCKKYADLKATILDLPEAAAAGRPEIEHAGLTDRISYVEGDFFKSDWGSGYDFALLSNILHALPEEQCQLLINRAFEALKPGGIIVTNDVDFPSEDEPIDFMAGWSSLLYFTMTGARTHPTQSVKAWIALAGFTNVKITKARTSARIVGHKTQ